ncbi:MAG: HAMP domain-containing sensor histidine kinase [Eubacteriales bacterium]|nr:HAMP domain-containing sensor histidine kinase [Eubacteriales bacterium]
MIKRLRRAFILGSALIFLFTVIFTLTLIWHSIEADKGNLTAILNAASGWTGESGSNLPSLANKIADSSPTLEVSFLLPNGIVLASSAEPIPDGQKILNTKAVKEALLNGIGGEVNFNRGLFSPTILGASLLGEGRMILFLVNTDRHIASTISVASAGFLALTLALIIVSSRMLNPITRDLIRQLNRVRALLEGSLNTTEVSPKDFFPELRDNMVNIIHLIDKMHYDLQQIQGTLNMQKDFVDNSSHELKSPLTSIYGFAQLLNEEDLSADEQKEYIGFILKDAERMMAVIKDILLLQKEETESPKNLNAINVKEIALEVAQSLAPQCLEKNITIEVSGECEIKILEQDLWDLLRNLMSNAVRYGKQDGNVWVVLSENTITVRDNGIGIAEEHHDRLFEKFYRVDKGRSRNMGGTGLGLAIVAGLVGKYNANIQLDSKEGEGTCFTVKF